MKKWTLFSANPVVKPLTYPLLLSTVFVLNGYIPDVLGIFHLP